MNVLVFVNVIVIIISVQLIVCTSSDFNASTLIFATIVIRHGDRAPVRRTYPTDPTRNKSFFPYTLGELTYPGLHRMIYIGVALNKRYKDFLGNKYYDGLITSRASNYSRTQESLNGLHAGLFPRKKAYLIFPIPKDKYLATHANCPKIITNLTYPPVPDEEKELYDYIKRHSGYANITYSEIFTIVDRVVTTQPFRHAVPKWLEPIYPEPMTSLAVRYYDIISEQKHRYGAGYLVQRIINDFNSAFNSTPIKKLFIYCGHDFTIAMLLGALNVWKSEMVGYGALVLLELHQIDQQLGIVIYYNNTNYNEPLLLTLPGCESFCPWQQFIELTHHLYEPPPECE